MDLFSLSGFELVCALGVASTIVFVASALALYLLRRRASKEADLAVNNAKHAQQHAESKECDEGKTRVRVLYGTQTGTAERFAKQLGNELRRKYGTTAVVDVIDLEKYNAEAKLQQESLVIFCLATYGDGEPTDNAAEFYNWIIQQADRVDQGTEEPSFQNVNFAVFGLGNKQYEQFCSVGKKVFKSLSTLGGKALVRRGDGDDDANIDDDFDAWCEELYRALEDGQLIGPVVENTEVDDTAEPAYDTQILPSDTAVMQPFPKGDGLSPHFPFNARVAVVRELHSAASDRSCVHVEIDVSQSSIKYEHGDHVGVYSQNSDRAVELAAFVLGLPLDTVFSLQIPQGANDQLHEPFPTPTTLKTALAYFADLFSSPSQAALLALSRFASVKEEGDRLKKLALLSAKQEYVEYVVKSKRSLLEIMQEFPSAKPTLGAFFASICPRLQPRLYSISSSPKQFPNTIHVTCAVVDERLPSRHHQGVCSSWLKNLPVGAAISVYVRHSHFRLPADPSTPVIMVGPGTGLAPFRGFLQERAAIKLSGKSLGPAEFFFGCRKREHDYIYEEELLSALSQGVISNLHVAFSRQNDVKDYVQHHIEKHAEALWPLLDEKSGYLYICGDGKHMAKDVHNTLVRLVQAKKKCSAGEAELHLKQMQERGHYLKDVW